MCVDSFRSPSQRARDVRNVIPEKATGSGRYSLDNSCRYDRYVTSITSFQPVDAHLTPVLSDYCLISTRLIGVPFLYGHHHMSSETNSRISDQPREINLGRRIAPCIKPTVGPSVSEPYGPDAANTPRLGLSEPYETFSIPSSTSRPEAPSRFSHVSSVNLGDFSINCSIYAYRRLTDPQQRSSLGPQRHSHDCVRRLIFFHRQYEETTTCQPNDTMRV